MNNTSAGTVTITCALKHNYYIPSEVLALPNIYGSSLEYEAGILRDSFESRTNGMFWKEKSGQLSVIEADSPLFAWFSLIETINSLYETEWINLASNLEKIPEESGPGLLKDVIEALGELPGGKEKRSRFTKSEKRLYNLVAEDRRFVKSVIMQLRDSMEAGEEYFFEFALLAIKEIREMDENIGHRLTLWCLEKVYQDELDYTEFLDSLKLQYPASLTMRFSALILTGEEPEEGIKCWLLSLIFRIREGHLKNDEAAEYLWIIAKLLSENNLKETGEIKQILLLLRNDLMSITGMVLDTLSEQKPFYHFLQVWADTIAPGLNPDFSTRIPAGISTEKETAATDNPAQLELFSTELLDSDMEICPGFPENEDGWDFRQEITVNGLLSPRPLDSPEELKTLLRARPRYVGPEPWLDVIRYKRKRLIQQNR